MYTILTISEANGAISSASRHSNASKYMNCLIGMNFPLQACKKKIVISKSLTHNLNIQLLANIYLTLFKT